MTAREVIAALNARGAVLTADGDRLRVDAPKGMMLPELLRRISQHDRELLIILSESTVRDTPATQPVKEPIERFLVGCACASDRSERFDAGTAQDPINGDGVTQACGDRGPQFLPVVALPDPWHEHFEERAAIREYDGEQTRGSAEEAALEEVYEAMERVRDEALHQRPEDGREEWR